MDDQNNDLRRQRDALKAEISASGNSKADGVDLERANTSIGDERLQNRNAAEPDLERVMDIPVRLTLEVGGTDMAIRDLLQLHQGGVVELDRQAGEALDVLVNGTLIARGEVVVVDEKLAIRLTEVVSASERLQSLK
ncbi:flagellar motor switch protein FliN [Spongiibacter sp. IMCC21906]|uniref:flagellar motor switch protein FliN n=1 Tax=Spongiibacter sp. IMCC21906 TaxID=1620392 RepID=UPI00062E0830|nr:flagellar motor switch protein FliN [Spongiibacter sp. IMCC21906]AKH69993.1 flagellar motor switch protein FliN [Spongiibacter sp. IMCC21906]